MNAYTYGRVHVSFTNDLPRKAGQPYISSRGYDAMEDLRCPDL